jgi:hypothetical protein
MSTPGFDAAPTIGALQIGVLFAVCLFGAVSIQVSYYFGSFECRFLRDIRWTGHSLLHSFSRSVSSQGAGAWFTLLVLSLHEYDLKVALVWCLDLGHTIAICNGLYIITVVQYGHPELLDIVPNSLNLSIVLSGFIGPLEQVRLPFTLDGASLHMEN